MRRGRRRRTTVAVGRSNISRCAPSLAQSTNMLETHLRRCSQGLGTSDATDAKKYFGDMRRHRLPFKTLTDEDRGLIDMAFNKKKADNRKEWLRGFVVRVLAPMMCFEHADARLTARHVHEPQCRPSPYFGLHQPRAHSLFHGRQYPINPFRRRWLQARSAQSLVRLLQEEA